MIYNNTVNNVRDIAIEDNIPYAIKKLGSAIRGVGGECYIYGECLLELILGKGEIRYYDILTSLPVSKLVSILDLDSSEGYKSRKSITLYSYYGADDGSFAILHEDFIDNSNGHSFFYINIFFSEGLLLDKLSSFLLPIERIAFDFSRFYFDEFLDDLFVSRKISVSEKEAEGLSYSLLSLFKLVRCIVKFGFDNTDIIEFRGRLETTKRLYPKLFWKLEILRFMELEKPSLGFELMREWGFLGCFFPELLEGYGVSQNEYHKYDVYYHSLRACDSADKFLPLIRFSALFHDIGKPRAKRKKYLGNNEDKDVFYDHENIGSRMSYGILRRFGFSYAAASRVANLVRLHMFHYTSSWTDKAVRRFMRKADSELDNLLELRKADRLGSGTKTANSKAVARLLGRINSLEREDNAFKIRDLNISGNDLKKVFLLKEGVIIGDVLSYLQSLVVNDGISNEKEVLLVHSREYLSDLGLYKKG